MARFDRGTDCKVVMRLAPQRKVHMRLALGGGGPEHPEGKAVMRRVNSGGYPISRLHLDREVRLGELPAAPKTLATLEYLEHAVMTQAAEAFAELARSRSQTAALADQLRLEQEARSRDRAEREELQRTVDDLQQQLTNFRNDSCLEGGARCCGTNSPPPGGRQRLPSFRRYPAGGWLPQLSDDMAVGGVREQAAVAQRDAQTKNAVELAAPSVLGLGMQQQAARCRLASKLGRRASPPAEDEPQQEVPGSRAGCRRWEPLLDDAEEPSGGGASVRGGERGSTVSRQDGPCPGPRSPSGAESAGGMHDSDSNSDSGCGCGSGSGSAAGMGSLLLDAEAAAEPVAAEILTTVDVEGFAELLTWTAGTDHLLSSGTYGEVLGGTFALKRAAAQQWDAVQVLTDERNMLQYLHDQGAERVIRVLATRTEGDQVQWFAMPRLVLSLHDAGQLHDHDLAKCARGLLQGLEHLERCGVVHLDVKPGNLMLDVDGEVTMIDFGLARRVQDREKPHSFFTPQWKPLECLLSEEVDADPSMDWYSAGLVLWQAATGAHPCGTEHHDLGKMLGLLEEAFGDDAGAVARDIARTDEPVGPAARFFDAAWGLRQHFLARGAPPVTLETFPVAWICPVVRGMTDFNPALRIPPSQALNLLEAGAACLP